MTIWTDEMKSAAMKDAAQVVKLTALVAKLEAALSEIHASTRRLTFDHEWYLEGLRHGPGVYVLMRVGPVPEGYEPTF